jgi:AraC-like DNA-binding protein
VLHLHVANRLIAELGREVSGSEVATLSWPLAPAADPMAEALGRALVGATRIGGSFGRHYADSLLAAARGEDPSERPKVAALAKWRLKRAIGHIEASLAESVSIADIASAAGLTRMHFAAQFKAATAMRPHEYLLRRWIARAQEKLAGTRMSLVDVALSVGFQTQPHFTTVFGRIVGETPRAWRRLQRAEQFLRWKEVTQ